MKKLECFGDRVLVRPIAAPQKTGGLAVPEQQRERPMEGEVLAVGPNAKYGRADYALGMNIWDGVDVGDIVLFGSYAGREIKFEGETLRLIRSEELDGRVVDE